MSCLFCYQARTAQPAECSTSSRPMLAPTHQWLQMATDTQLHMSCLFCYQGRTAQPAECSTASTLTLAPAHPWLGNRYPGLVVARPSLSECSRVFAGDALAINMPMTVEAVVIYLGIIYAGCAAVSIADSFAPSEISTRLQIAQAKAIFVQDVILRGGKAHPLHERVVKAQGPPAIVLPAAPGKHLQVILGLPCPALPCPALPCPALPCPALPCPAIFCCSLLSKPVLCHGVLCSVRPSRAVLCCAVLCRAVLCCAVLYCAVLCCAELIKLALLCTIAQLCQSNVTASSAYLKCACHATPIIFQSFPALHCCSEPGSGQQHCKRASTHVQVQLRGEDMSYADFLSKGDGRGPVAPHVADASDTCNILFSSGTTGELYLCMSQLSTVSHLAHAVSLGVGYIKF